MRVEKVDNSQSFGVNVDRQFVRAAENFYLKRGLGYQYDGFHKALDKFETYGSENTEIIYRAFPKANGRFEHQLCLNNPELFQKPYIIKTSDKYGDILKFFTNLTDRTILEFEEAMTKLGLKSKTKPRS